MAIPPQKEIVMLAYEEALSLEYLRQVLMYDPTTGVFTWRVRTGRRMRVGSRAGGINGTYRSVCIDKVAYREHRLAWFYVHGRWPSLWVDHVNRDGFDNRIANLRECNSSQNSSNTRHRSNVSGFKGVSYFPQTRGWRARLMVRGKEVLCTYHKTPQAAAQAYDRAAVEAFGPFAKLNFPTAKELDDMAKPSEYAPSIPETNSSVQNGQGPQKTAGKARARYPDPPLLPEQDKAQGGGKRAYTPGGPAGS